MKEGDYIVYIYDDSDPFTPLKNGMAIHLNNNCYDGGLVVPVL